MVTSEHITAEGSSTAQQAVRWTASGKRIDLLQPQAELLDIRDIAAHLANMPRWGGAVRGYSVAQHCVLGAQAILDGLVNTFLRIAGQRGAQYFAYDFLLHDAHEAYLQDLISPIKQHMATASYRAQVQWFDTLLGVRFGCLGAYSYLSREVVGVVDLRMLATEEKHFFGQVLSTKALPFPGLSIDPWPAEFAEQAFLGMFLTLKPAAVHA